MLLQTCLQNYEKKTNPANFGVVFYEMCVFFDNLIVGGARDFLRRASDARSTVWVGKRQ